MIKVFTTRTQIDNYRQSIKSKSIGLVPTMGNLHQGHISLIEKSTKDNDITIVTIYVNPKQFGPQEDFNKYPRTLDEDLAKISALHQLLVTNKELIVYAPRENEEIYPNGFSTNISLGPMTQKFEGAIRPTHFDGVTTVVHRLFTITKAHTAYFGQKDVQQCLIIKKMIKDLEIPIEIEIMPIVRNTKGLALSSRNQFLSEVEKERAMTLPTTLRKIEKLIRTKQDYIFFLEDTLKNDSKWDYLEVLDSSNLETPTTSTIELVLLGAYKVGTTRLLDNILIPTNEGK